MTTPDGRTDDHSRLFMHDVAEKPMNTSPSPNYDSTWSVLDDVAERAKRYLRSVNERRVAPTREAVAGLAALDVPLQDRPIPPEKVVEELDRIAGPATLTISGPRFFGFVNGGSLPPRAPGQRVLSGGGRDRSVSARSSPPPPAQ